MTAKETHRAYLQSDHWKRLKCKLNIRCGRRCETCNHDGRLWPIDGHHLVYRTPLELGTVDELLGLCRRCHDIVHDLNIETWFAVGSPLEVRRETTIREIRRYLPELEPVISSPAPKNYPRLQPGQTPRIHRTLLKQPIRHASVRLPHHSKRKKNKARRAAKAARFSNGPLFTQISLP